MEQEQKQVINEQASQKLESHSQEIAHHDSVNDREIAQLEQKLNTVETLNKLTEDILEKIEQTPAPAALSMKCKKRADYIETINARYA